MQTSFICEQAAKNQIVTVEHDMGLNPCSGSWGQIFIFLSYVAMVKLEMMRQLD